MNRPLDRAILPSRNCLRIAFQISRWTALSLKMPGRRSCQQAPPEELDTIITTEYYTFSEELNEEDQKFLRQYNLSNHTASRAPTTCELDLAQMGWWCNPDNIDKAFLSRYAKNHLTWGFESPEESAWREEQEERIRVERETQAVREA